MTKRKLFGENKGTGVAGVSLLSFGLDMRRRNADPYNILELLQVGNPKPVRKVVLRKDPVAK